MAKATARERHHRLEEKVRRQRRRRAKGRRSPANRGPELVKRTRGRSARPTPRIDLEQAAKVASRQGLFSKAAQRLNVFKRSGRSGKGRR